MSQKKIENNNLKVRIYWNNYPLRRLGVSEHGTDKRNLIKNEKINWKIGKKKLYLGIFEIEWN